MRSSIAASAARSFWSRPRSARCSNSFAASSSFAWSFCAGCSQLQLPHAPVVRVELAPDEPRCSSRST